MQANVQQMTEKDRCGPQAAARIACPLANSLAPPGVRDQPRWYEALRRPFLSLGETTALVQIGV